MTDYEKAMRGALCKVYPASEHFGCWFHFCQAVRRRANKEANGLVAFIKSNNDALEIYGKLLCLPLLPAKQINETFQSIKSDAYEFESHMFGSFIKYYQLQWIETVS